MEKTITVTINLSGLPDAPNQHRLSVALEAEISDAVARAIADAFEDGLKGKDWHVHVPSF